MVMQSPKSTSGNWSSLYTLCEVAASKSTSNREKSSSESVKDNTQVLTCSSNIKHMTVNKVVESSKNPSKNVASRSMDESMVAAALLELSGSPAINSVENVNSNNQLKSMTIGINQAASCDMKPVDLSNNSGKTVAPSDHVGKQQVHLLLPQTKLTEPLVSQSFNGQRSTLPMIHCIAVKNNDNGAKLIQLPKGFEYLLQANTGSTATPAIKPIMNTSNRASTVASNVSLVTGIISKTLATSNLSSSSNNINNINNNNNNNTSHSIAFDSNNNSNINNGHRSVKSTAREVSNSNNVLHLQPNVYHFFSPSSSANQQNNSASANFASIGFKKRGRKRLYEGADGTGNSTTNPIKEFRLRQRRREHEENILLNELEDRYRKSPEYSIKLEALYDANSLNIHFPRIKTNLKRGKAKDDVERINRKKLCARRDSKNYRERAKMKRELITKKIQLLENIFNNPNGTSCTPAAIQIIDPSSFINGSSNSSTCSSSASASPSQVTSLLPVTSTSSSSSSSSSSSASPSPDLISSSPCMPNLFLFKRP